MHHKSHFGVMLRLLLSFGLVLLSIAIFMLKSTPVHRSVLLLATNIKDNHLEWADPRLQTSLSDRRAKAPTLILVVKAKEVFRYLELLETAINLGCRSSKALKKNIMNMYRSRPGCGRLHEI